uniref:Transmembrane protein 234 n=1 Tax=Timema douglasi TaxID=61478 RepID=A0A7R8VL43_TIMDO|nr:unnamed protein product [Timema douglasi]
MGSFIVLLLVGMLWGCTNPLIKKASAGIEKVNAPNYLVPLVLNQAGSLLYFLALAKTDLSLSVPVANSLTFVFTALTGIAIGEETPNKAPFRENRSRRRQTTYAADSTIVGIADRSYSPTTSRTGLLTLSRPSDSTVPTSCTLTSLTVALVPSWKEKCFKRHSPVTKSTNPVLPPCGGIRKPSPTSDVSTSVKEMDYCNNCIATIDIQSATRKTSEITS